MSRPHPQATGSACAKPVAGPSHDAEYYFDDELSVFMVRPQRRDGVPASALTRRALQVEQKLFRVHRHYLARDSEFFRGLFACPAPPGEDVEGRTDDKPIVLYGVTAHEFRCLLRFFYDG